jgi:phage terminase Nu1 subunit (DNA packaging protein)
LNRNEMAGAIGVSSMTLARYVAAGCPCIDPGATGRAAKFNELEVRAWVEERRRTKSSPASDDGKRRFSLAAAELKELQLAEKRGSMIRVEDVVPIVADELANVRSRLMAMPGRLAPGLVGQDAASIEASIADEISAALGELTYGQAT